MDQIEWYKERNDRTNRVDNIILDSSAKRIGVYIPSESAQNYSTQVLAFLTINIMSRWCRRITIQMANDIECKISGRSGNLKAILSECVSQNDPFGDFSFNDLANVQCDIHVKIGYDDIFQTDDFWAQSDGWIAGYGFGKQPSELESNGSINPVGACFAACQLNSAVFRNYLSIGTTENFHRWYSLFNYESSSSKEELDNPGIEDTLQLGRLWQIGCGAVGSSFSTLLSMMNVVGIVHPLDFDKVKIPNTSSSLLFTADDALNKRKKVDVCHSALSKNQNLKSLPFEGDFNTFIESGNLEENHPDIVLCFANERNVWSAIQYNCPPFSLHATTSKNWAINFGRHIPFKEWCLVCRFGLKQHDSTPTCAEGVQQNSDGDEEILGILPFLAPAAATQVLAEVLRLAMKKGYPNNKNFLQFSLKHNGNSNFQLSQIGPKVNCPVCANQSLNEYPNVIRKKIEDLGNFLK